MNKLTLVRIWFFVLAGLFAWLGLPQAALASPPVYATGQCVGIYDCSHGVLSVIDTATSSVTATIPLGVAPDSVATSLDGSQLYAVNSCIIGINDYCSPGVGSVWVFDVASGMRTATIPTGFGPISAIVSPDGKRIYVANVFDDSVTVINAATDEVIKTVLVPLSLGAYMYSIALSPDGSQLYATLACAYGSLGPVCAGVDGSVVVLDTASYKIIATIQTGESTNHIAVSPDGTRAYAANQCQNYTCSDDGTVSIINLENDTVIKTVTVGRTSDGLAVTPDGSRAYVANSNDSDVSVIDTATGSVLATIPLPANEGYYPELVTISADGSRVYVVSLCVSYASCDNGVVSVIDTATNEVLNAIPAGISPYGIAVGPGALIAKNSSVRAGAGTQLSGTVPPPINTTSCAFTLAVQQVPARGSFNFDGTTGAWTYTPTSATYSGPGTFTWRAEAPANCTAADNPTDPVSNTATAVLSLTPLMTALDGITLTAGESRQETFSLTGSTPFRHSFASSNATVLPPADLTVIPAACGEDDAHLNCTLRVSAAAGAGTATIAFSARGRYGVSTTRNFPVTVNKPAPPTLSGLKALAVTSPSSGTETFQITGTGQLAVTATSSNPELLPDGSITGASTCSVAGPCTLTLKPAGQHTGKATVTVQVADSYGQTQTGSFTYTVNAAPSTGGGSGMKATSGGGGIGGAWLLILAALELCVLSRRFCQRFNRPDPGG